MGNGWLVRAMLRILRASVECIYKAGVDEVGKCRKQFTIMKLPLLS